MAVFVDIFERPPTKLPMILATSLSVRFRAGVGSKLGIFVYAAWMTAICTPFEYAPEPDPKTVAVRIHFAPVNPTEISCPCDRSTAKVTAVHPCAVVVGVSLTKKAWPICERVPVIVSVESTEYSLNMIRVSGEFAGTTMSASAWTT